MKKLLILAILVVLVASAYASAALLDVEGGAIQAGVDDYLVCDPDGVFVLGWGLETDDNLVHFVRIGGIQGSCFGNALFVRVLDGGGGILAQGSFDPINASEVIVTFNAPAPPEDIEQIFVWIEGPLGIDAVENGGVDDN